MNDRLLRACRGEPVDRTPVWFMRQAGRYQPEYRALRERYSLLDLCRVPDLCTQVTLYPVEQLGVDAAILFSDITLPLLGLGVEFEIVEGIGPVIDAPIRTEERLARGRNGHFNDSACVIGTVERPAQLPPKKSSLSAIAQRKQTA